MIKWTKGGKQIQERRKTGRRRSINRDAERIVTLLPSKFGLLGLLYRAERPLDNSSPHATRQHRLETRASLCLAEISSTVALPCSYPCCLQIRVCILLQTRLEDLVTKATESRPMLCAATTAYDIAIMSASTVSQGVHACLPRPAQTRRCRWAEPRPDRSLPTWCLTYN